MIRIEQWHTIRTLYAQGYGKKTIARMLNVSRNTVKNALKDEAVPKYIRQVIIPKKIDPFANDVKDMYFQKGFIGTRIYEEIKKLGYTGSDSGVYRFLKTLGSKTPKKTTMRFETEMGKQAQFDWSPYTIEINGNKEKVICFLMVLGYSRLKAVTFSKDDKADSIYEAIEDCFEQLGGVCESLLIDNAKALVLKHLQDEEPIYNPRFLELSGSYCFKPHACKPHMPRTKGKVERSFYYIEQHFIKGGSFNSMDDLSLRAKEFINNLNFRTHSTTQQIPAILFEKEKKYLLPLPKRRYTDSLKELRKVNWDCLISYDGCRYSVPNRFAGKDVFVKKVKGYILKIYTTSGEIVAEHIISSTKGLTIINNEHYEGLFNKYPKSVALLRDTISETFSNGQQFFIGLEKNINNYNIHAQKVFALRETYEDRYIDEVLGKAISYSIYHSDSIKNLLKPYPIRCEKPTLISNSNAKSIQTHTRTLEYYKNLLK